MNSLRLSSALVRHWRFLLLAAAVFVGTATGTALLTVGHLRGQTPSGQRVLVTGQNETDPAVATLATDLKKRGFTVSKDPSTLSSLSTSTTLSLVLTSNALHAASPDTLRALYAKGVVVAAVNVSLPDLAAILEPNGPSRPALPGLKLSTPAPSEWLPTSSQYTLYTVMSPGSKTSIVLTSTDALVDIVERREPGHPVIRATPPAPFMPGPSQSSTPSSLGSGPTAAPAAATPAR